MRTIYIDSKKRTYMVRSPVLAPVSGEWWGTYVTHPMKLKQTLLTELPNRATAEEAQKDLDQYAQEKGLKALNGS